MKVHHSYARYGTFGSSLLMPQLFALLFCAALHAIFLLCVCTDAEKKLVEEVFNNAIDSLSDDDRKLPQVLTLQRLLF